MNAPTPRQRRKARNRNVILDTAAALILKYGIENVSLREIAKQADYSPAGLYKYFDGKAALLHGLLTRENQQLIEQLRTVPTDISAEQQLVAACLLYVRYNLENPAYTALVSTLVSGRTSQAEPVPADSPFAVFFHLVQDWEAAESFQLPPDYGCEEVTYALWALTHGMAALRLNQLRDFEADFEAANRKTLEVFLKGLRS